MLRGKLGRFHILLLAEILVMLVLVPGCFRRAQLIYEVTGDSIVALETSVGDGKQFQGYDMELRPGVYRVEMECHPNDTQSIYVDILCEGGSFKALRSSGVPIFPNQSQVNFEVYVGSKIPGAYLQCNMQGGGGEIIDSIEIYKTNLGNRKMLFLALCCFAALDALLVWRRRILDGKIGREQQFVFWGLTGTVLLAFFPYLTDYVYSGADTFFHVTRIEALKESLLNGCPIPIRVQDYWLYGHGYAVSLFYGDLFFMFPALLRMLGFSLMAAYRTFVLAIIALTAVIAYWSLHKCTENRYASLFGAVLYTLSPYYIYDIYNRGAIGECLGMCFMPLVCCAMYLLFTKEADSSGYRRYKWYLVIGMTALLQSHLISTVFTALFIALACVIFRKKTFRRQTLRELSLATGIVILVNCWFWLPMVYMMSHDRFRVMEIVEDSIQDKGVQLAGFFQLLPNQGGYQEGMYNCEPIQLGVAAILTMVVYLGFIFGKRRKMRGAEKSFGGLTLLALVLSTKYIPWDMMQKIPALGRMLSIIQFPTRFMMFATVFFAMFAAFVYKRLQEERRQGLFSVSALGIYVAAVVSCVYHVNDIAFEKSPMYVYAAQNMGTSTLINGEYLLDGAYRTDYYSHKPVAEQGLVWYGYEKQGTEAVISIRNTTGELRYLEMPIIGYKGYAVELMEGAGETPYVAEERGTHGDLKIGVPAEFQGTIRVWYQGFALFRVAEIISGVSVLFLVCYGLRQRRTSRIERGLE